MKPSLKDALKNAGLDPARHMVAVTSETSPLAKSEQTISLPSLWTTISVEDIPYLHLLLAEQSYLWHSGRKYLLQFLDGAAAEDKLAANKDDIFQNPAMLDALIGCI